MFYDHINAGFEWFAALVLILNVIQIRKDKRVSGVSIWPAAVFAAWGFFNIFFYSHLNQSLSAIAAVFVALANVTWLGHVFYYGWKAKQIPDNKYRISSPRGTLLLERPPVLPKAGEVYRATCEFSTIGNNHYKVGDTFEIVKRESKNFITFHGNTSSIGPLLVRTKLGSSHWTMIEDSVVNGMLVKCKD